MTDFATALRWFEQVGKGLAALHAVGMVHRDLKPSNILIGPDGVARIADLGIARRIDAGHTLVTTTGHAAGTFEYMAPEQVQAPDRVDGRADLYALAVTFHELLTGARPVGAWRPASVVNPTVPPRFDAILGHGLAPRPEDRPHDVYELLAALAAARSSFLVPPTDDPHRGEGNPRAGTDPGLLPHARRTLPAGWATVSRTLVTIRDEFRGIDRGDAAPRYEAVWGSILLGAFGGGIGLPTGLLVAVMHPSPTPGAAIGAMTLVAIQCGIVGGLVGATWGAWAGSSRWNPGAIPPAQVAAGLAWLNNQLQEWWRKFRASKPPLGSAVLIPDRMTIDVPPAVAGSPDVSQQGLAGGVGSLLDRVQPWVEIAGSTVPDPGDVPPVELKLHRKSLLTPGARTPWSLSLAEDAATLTDPLVILLAAQT